MSTAVPEKRSMMAGFWAFVMLIIILIASAIPFLGASGADGQTNLQPANPTPSATPTATAEGCDPAYTQVEVDRVNSQDVEPRFEETMTPIVQNAALSAEERNAAILEADFYLAGTNAQTLAAWAKGMELYEDSNAWPELVEGGKIVNGACLSEAGILLFKSWKHVRTATAQDVTVEQADTAWTNSGINGDTNVVSATPGIGGDNLVAIVVTMPDGTKFIRLIRCGNVIWIKIPPSLPPGETDNPKCPYDANLPFNSPYCVEPKKSSEDPNVNSNIDDWIKDTGGGGHTVTTEDGSKVSNGYQADPQGDAQKAEQEAEASNQANTEAHEDAVEEAIETGGGIVDIVQDHGATTDPNDPGNSGGEPW